MAMASELLGILENATLASSGGVLLTLLLRKPMRTFFGPSLAYCLWLLVPTSILVPLLPAPSAGFKSALPVSLSMHSLTGHVALVPMSSGLDWVTCLICTWGVGALLFCSRLARQQRHFIASLGLPFRDDGGVLRASIRTGSPVVVGIVRPKIIVPSDFATRYASEEQALILAHERMHVRRGDLITNAMWALARCIFWFNPLIHVAAWLSRFDQELACDAAVMRSHPKSRKPYATAMLRVQLADDDLPLGCYWSSAHPLKERIMLLNQPSARGLRRAIGRILVGTCICLVGCATWAVESDVTAAADSAPEADGAGVNFSDAESRMPSDNTTTLAAPAGETVAQSLAAASLPAPKRALVPRAQLAPGQVWQCVIDGQRVFSDGPCGKDASVRRLSDPNIMDAVPAKSHAYGDHDPLPQASPLPLAPAAADQPEHDSGSSGPFSAAGRGRRPHPHPQEP
jgi:beta-lactamase regulating signal transducer with metallopeptidase domain